MRERAVLIHKALPTACFWTILFKCRQGVIDANDSVVSIKAAGSPRAFGVFGQDTSCENRLGVARVG